MNRGTRSGIDGEENFDEGVKAIGIGRVLRKGIFSVQNGQP